MSNIFCTSTKEELDYLKLILKDNYNKLYSLTKNNNSIINNIKSIEKKEYTKLFNNPLIEISTKLYLKYNIKHINGTKLLGVDISDYIDNLNLLLIGKNTIDIEDIRYDLGIIKENFSDNFNRFLLKIFS
jgi:hypothetical protein